KLNSSLSKKIEENISKNKKDKICLCFSDEGLWAEYLKKYQVKSKYNIELINIQHGSFLMNKVPFVQLRKFINSLIWPLLRFPLFGFDFGGSKLDTYFVYSQIEKDFLASKSLDSRVFISPVICKFHLINEYLKFVKIGDAGIEKVAFFAMQPPKISQGCKYSEAEIYTILLPFFEHFSRLGYTMYFRLHPGTLNPAHSIKLLRQYGIANHIIIANDKNIEYYLAKSSIVISFHSTVIFDANILGKLPIVIKGFMEGFNFPIKHEIVNILNNWQNDLENALSKKMLYKRNIDIEFENEIIDFFK
ncbi:MAG: hypothetical protein JSR12_11385, partial [Bacteroidetes bacterium]|nr:hypothetical protein [Bacteroidota bacterium]